LPDDALVVHGGRNLPESFVRGAGVTVDDDGKLRGVSVNCAPQTTVDALTGANPSTGYPGILHGRVGVTTVGAVRNVGGDVTSSPTKRNSNHATLNGLTPDQASELFRPTRKNPRYEHGEA